MSLRVAVVSLNFNGRALLEKYIPSLEAACRASRYKPELWVLDNDSKDDSLLYLTKHHPSVKVFKAAKNKVLCSYNDWAEQVPCDVMIFMNNDIAVDEHFVDPLAQRFEDEQDLFFVTPRCLSLEGHHYEGNKTKAMIRYGVFWASSLFPGYESGTQTAGPTFAGGFGAFDRRKFLSLGGYDELYLPGRLEDADICFRAQKRGWRCLYEPASIVYHEGMATFHKVYGRKGTDIVNWRNTFLFMWKNLSDPFLWLAHVFWMPWRLLYALIFLRWDFVRGFGQALVRAPQAFSRRKSGDKPTRHRISDQKVFEWRG
jgi:GT2 family glycosyltransferase